MDTLAKSACEEPGKANVMMDGAAKVASAGYGSPSGGEVTGDKRVSEGVPKHRQGSMISTEKVSKLHVVSDGLKLDMVTAGKTAWGSHMP